MYKILSLSVRLCNKKKKKMLKCDKSKSFKDKLWIKYYFFQVLRKVLKFN